MLRSPLRQIVVGFVLIPLGIVGSLVPFFEAADKAPEASGSAFLFIPSVLAVPLGVLLVTLGTADGYRALRALGWREHPVAAALVAGGALVSLGGVLALLALPKACVSL